jgi:chromosome segregation ATPase
MIETFLTYSGPAGIIGLIVFFLKDYRQAKADAALAERTIGSRTDAVSTSASEARFALIQKAWDGERESLNRQLEDLRARLNAKDVDIAAQDRRIQMQETHIAEQAAEIAELRDQLQQIQAQARALQRQVNALIRQRAQDLSEGPGGTRD